MNVLVWVVARRARQGVVQLRRDRERDAVAARLAAGRTRAVGGEVELLGQSGQRALPVGELLGCLAVGVVLVAEDLVLPERVVGVLHRQRRPVRGVALGARRVRGGEVPRQGPRDQPSLAMW